MPILPEEAWRIKIPEMIKVRQVFPDEKIDDVKAATESEIFREDISALIKPGQSVAVLVGSRGIKNLKEIVKTTVDCLHKMGAKPFIVPAMGSHGGATAEGQVQILSHYGITEDYIKAPIKSAMETVVIGYTDTGVPVHMDKYAAESDAIVAVARIKPHTDFDGPIQSGMCKMLSIGVGKHNGCSRLHQEGSANFPRLLPHVASIVIDRKNVAFSIAIIENAHDNTCLIKAVRGDKTVSEEPGLFAISERLMPSLQFEGIDVLIVEKIGKEISGNGMDTNITGRLSSGPAPGYKGPFIKRIIALDLFGNNAIGVAAADFITRKLYDKIDFISTYANAIASASPEAARIPPVMDDEEQALRAAIQCLLKTDPDNVKIVRIKHTLDLINIEVSKNLLEYCKSSDKFIVFD